MRILMSTSTFPRFAGDSVTPFMLNLAKALVGKGLEIDVIAPHAPGSLTSEVLAPGLAVSRFRYAWPEAAEDVCYGAGALENLRQHPWRVIKLPLLVTAQAAALHRLLQRKQYDVVHAHWLLPQGATAVAVATATPVLVSAHGSDVFGLQGGISRLCKRWVLRHASLATANSAATASAMRALGVPADRISIVRIGTALDPQLEPTDSLSRPSSRQRPCLLFVGRLIDLKGIDDAIHALVEVRQRFPDAKLVIAGDGPLRMELERLTARVGLLGAVIFAGWLQPDQVRNLMLQSDVLVVPSRQGPGGTVEGQGVVPLEAMIMGLPVVATRSGGLSEIVRHEQTGLLVKERSPEDIAQATCRILEDETLRSRLVGAAMDWARAEGTMLHTADQFIRLYAKARDQRSS